jgi:hypothetical protein
LKSGNVELRGNVLFWKKTAAAQAAVDLGLPADVLDEKTSGTDNTRVLDPKAPDGAAAAPVTGLEEMEEVATVESSPAAGGWHFTNKHLIKVKRQKNGEVVVVRVLDSRKYVRVMRSGKPMELRIVPGQEGTWWRPAGREPRFGGAY